MTGHTIASDSTISNITGRFKHQKDEPNAVIGIHETSEVESHLDDDNDSIELPDLISLSGYDDVDTKSDMDQPHLWV